MKIAIAGCTGRMGLTLMRLAQAMEGVQLVGGSVKPEDEADALTVLNKNGIDTEDLQIVTETAVLVSMADAVIDFSAPAYSLQIAEAAAQQQKIHVCGTTGFDESQKTGLADAGKTGRIIWAPNMALGVNLVAAMVQKVAAALDTSFDIEVVEMHHKHKVDAPSGTALLFGEAAAKGRDIALEDNAVRVRDGVIGAREEGTIGFATLRGGDVIGDHTVIFAGEGERIELSHKSSSRDIYARGALKAALWAQDKGAGFYTLEDVLGL